MAVSHGSTAGLYIGTASSPDNASVDMGKYANTLGGAFDRDTAEVTTMGVGSKKYIAGLKDATIPFEGPFDTDADPTLWELYDQGTLVALEYYPAGKGTTGTPKFSCHGFLTSYELTSDVSDANTFSSEWQVSGNVTRTVQ